MQRFQKGLSSQNTWLDQGSRSDLDRLECLVVEGIDPNGLWEVETK